MIVPIPRRGFTFWAQEESVFVTAYHRDTNQQAWKIYNDGLYECYRRYNIDLLLDEKSISEQPLAAFWLIRDPTTANVLGGFRWTGPFFKEKQIDSVPALHDVRTSPSFPRLRSAVASYIAQGGIIEVKGAWSAPGVSNLGDISFLSPYHAFRIFSIKTAIAATSTQRLKRATSCGHFMLEGIQPAAGYPIKRYDSIALFCTAENFTQLPEKHRVRILREQAYLAPFGCGVPPTAYQIFFDLPYRTELIAKGVAEQSGLKQQLHEANKCGHRDEVASISPHAHPWVYYPWRRSMVQVLAPDLFWKVRQDRNRNKLTLNEMDMLRTKRIGVVGLSVGASIAYCLAQQGMCGELRIADFDDLELSNMNRLSASLLDLGLPKVEIATRKIAEINPFLLVREFDKGITQENVDDFLRGLDVVVEECDSFDVKLLIRKRARDFGIPVVMETTENGILDVERFDIEDVKPFHGLVPELPLDELATWGMNEKIPYGLDLLGVENISSRFGASLIEINKSISSWPQLAEEVALGTSLAVSACRRILLGRHLQSGRVQRGLDETLERVRRPEPSRIPPEKPAMTERSPLPSNPLAAIEVAAHIAPSGGNMQPWLFSINGSGFSVHAKSELHVEGINIGRRGTAVSCGAALGNAWCMASYFKLLSQPGERPRMYNDPKNPEFCGWIEFGSQSDDLADLASFIQQRSSNRQPGPPEPLSMDVVHKLERVASRGGARLIYVPVDKLEPVVKAWGESDRIRMLDKRLHQELFAELREPYEENLQEGIDVRTLELSKLDNAILPLLRRWDVVEWLSEWDLGAGLSELSSKALRQSAGIVVIAVKGHTWADYVRGGFAMQLTWLEATRLGLSMQVYTPLFSFSHSKEDLVSLVGEQRGSILQRAKEESFSSFGLEPDESFVLALRVHRGPPPSALSERRPLSQQHLDQAQSKL